MGNGKIDYLFHDFAKDSRRIRRWWNDFFFFGKNVLFLSKTFVLVKNVLSCPPLFILRLGKMPWREKEKLVQLITKVQGENIFLFFRLIGFVCLFVDCLLLIVCLLIAFVDCLFVDRRLHVFS